MSYIQVMNYRSKTLKRNVSFNIILPMDSENGMEHTPFKTLYLLHGLTDNHMSWVTNTRIQRWAMKHNMAVVMPSGENSFYINTPVPNSAYGDFGEYVGKELVEITRAMFPLSHKREDTFIAGLSMGGYGAARNGLKYSDTFGYIAVLSGALHFFEYDPDWKDGDTIGEKACFGNLYDAIETDKNPRVIARALSERAKTDSDYQLPKVYVCCGTEDALLGANKSFAEYLKENGFDVTYEDGPGFHDWEFWDTYIEKVINWLPV